MSIVTKPARYMPPNEVLDTNREVAFAALGIRKAMDGASTKVFYLKPGEKVEF